MCLLWAAQQGRKGALQWHPEGEIGYAEELGVYGWGPKDLKAHRSRGNRSLISCSERGCLGSVPVEHGGR